MGPPGMNLPTRYTALSNYADGQKVEENFKHNSVQSCNKIAAMDDRQPVLIWFIKIFLSEKRGDELVAD